MVVLQLETALKVAWDCLNEGEEQRLRDWLQSHPDPGYAEIIARALELAEKGRAA